MSTTAVRDVRVQASAKSQAVAAALAVAGAAGTVIGFVTSPDRAWPNLLVGAFYLLALSVSAIFFLATQRLTSARWSAGLRRVPEAFLPILPVAAVLMAIVCVGHQNLYSWSHPGAFDHEPAIAGKVAYLKLPLVYGRLALTVGIWGLFAWLFRRTSRRQDANPGLGLVLHGRLNRYSALFVPLFALSFTAMAYDWIISLEPEWFSTMFGVYVFAGCFVQGIAAISLVSALLVERGHLHGAAGGDQLHDLGKMLFAFSTFWAYIWTCQYLLIWYANIPEEVTHHLKRTSGPWIVPFGANLIVNWIVPFLLLLSASIKRRPRVLVGAGILILVGRWLDLYMLIMPTQWDGPKLGLSEIAMPVACGAIAYLIVVRSLARAPLVPLGDPIMAADRPGHADHVHPWRKEPEKS